MMFQGGSDEPPFYFSMEDLKVYLSELSCYLKSLKIYLVGGLVRDILLKKERDIIDCDFAIEAKASHVSKEFAQKIEASWFILDEINQVYRVIKRKKNVYQFDFCALKGKDIIYDLKNRDFTINAMGIELKENLDLSLSKIIDPCNGRADLDKKIIRCVEEENLTLDPVRILRGISLASELGFEIEDKTLKSFEKYAHLLSEISGERISEELFKILKNEFSWKYFELMNALRILDYIFSGWDELKKPYPGPYHHLPIELHSIASLKQLELLLQELKNWKELHSYLNEEVRENRLRLEILKLATLLHDIGKAPAYFIDQEGKVKFTRHEKIGNNIAKEISERLKFSKREKDILSDMIYYHLRPGFLVDCLQESKRAVFRYFRDTDQEAISIILLSIADKEATRGELISEEDIKRHKEALLELIYNYFKKREEIKPPKLITGHDVMNILGIPPSSKVGQILKEIQEKQALGEIKSREEALKYLEEIKHNL